jgi:hypothetical protein
MGFCKIKSRELGMFGISRFWFKPISFLFFNLNFISIGFSQSNGGQVRDGSAFGYDSGYVVSFRDNLVITLVNETKFSSISVGFTTPKGIYNLDYKTNTINTWGVGIDYKWLTFEYTRQMPWYTPAAEFGEVQNAGFGFGVTGRRIAFRNFYETSKGYYLENTDDWKLGALKDLKGYYLRPDISTSTYYASLNYVFNNKHFSNNASLWQLERQVKKSGTLVGGLTYMFNNFKADSSIIPFTGIDSLPRSSNTFFALNSLGFNIGFMGTLPLGKKKKWFLTTAIIPGLSRQWGEASVEDGGVAPARKLLGYQSEFRLGLGYNGDNWYVGSIAKAYSNLNVATKEEPFSISNSFGRFYVGYRFNSPNFKHPFFKRIGL